MRKPNIIELAMKYQQVTLSLFTLLVLFGGYSILTMQRSEDPNLDIKRAIVYAVYPGANILQVEEQVTNKIEELLFSYEEVDKTDTYSVTREGQVVVTIDIQDHVDNEDLDIVWSKLRAGLANLSAELPRGVIGPILNSDFGETTAIMVSLSSERHSYAEKKEFLEKLEDEIKRLDNASKINRLGLQQEQITVVTNTQKLSQFGITPQQAFRAIQEQNSIRPTGELTNEGFNVPINTNTLYKAEEQLMDQIIYYRPDGKTIRLKDIAKIERGYADLTSKVRKNKQDALVLSVEMQPGNNIVFFGEELQDAIDKVKAELPPDVKIDMLHSQPEIVESAVNHFFIEFMIAVVAVIIVIMLLLPLRMASVSAIASPVSILITFAVLNLIGLGIHSVTLAGMIICLGMVVDDAVIIVDNYIEKLDEGMGRWESAWKAATQLFVPVMTATATIIFAFLPLSFMLEGISSDFVFTMPITVSLALATSFFVAIFLTPYLCYIFIKKGVKVQENRPQNRFSLLQKAQSGYDRSIDWAFKKGKLVLTFGAVTVLIGIFLFTKVPQQFFPKLQRDVFNLEIWLAEGTSVETTEKLVIELEGMIEKDGRIKEISSFIGVSSPRFHPTYAPTSPAENYAQIFIKTVDAKAAEELIPLYIADLEDYFPEATIRVRQISYEEFTTPIEIRVKGDRIEDITSVGEQVKQILQDANGTNWVHTNWREPYYRMGIEIDESEANRVGLSTVGVSEYIGGLMNGFPISTYWEGEENVNVSFRLEDAYRNSFDDLQNLNILTRSGRSVPLRQVASIRPSWLPGRLAHHNGIRTVTVRAEAQLGRYASEILKDVDKEIAKIDMPDGVFIEYGGDHESTLDNMPNMVQSLMVSILLIFMVLIFQFRDIKKSLIILSTFILAIPGAALGLLILGHPFGFTAFLGTISLIGIVVRNGIILVDYADELVHHHGHSIEEAALLSAKRRMRPIFLTASAAAIGVVPMIIGGSPLWAPLASVLCVGLMWSMFMTLYIIPLMYKGWIKESSNEVSEKGQVKTLNMA